MSRTLLLSGCIKEVDVWYDNNDNLASEQGWAGEQSCAELAAATDGALFWTYDSHGGDCLVKSTDEGRKYQTYQGLVSGSKECGVASKESVSGKEIFILTFQLF